MADLLGLLGPQSQQQPVTGQATPYMSPEQIQQLQEYARGLLPNPNGQLRPVEHYTQGWAHMLNALIGRNTLNRTNAQQIEQRNRLFEGTPNQMGPTGLANDPRGRGPPLPNAPPVARTPLLAPMTQGDINPRTNITTGSLPSTINRNAPRGNASFAPGFAPDSLPGETDILHPSYLAAIQRHEGFTPRAAWDYRQYSSGYGTRARGPEEVIDRQEAERRFQGEILGARDIVRRLGIQMTPGQEAALTSLTFNAGGEWINSGLGAAVRSGDWPRAQQLFRLYNRAGGQQLPGLMRRRNEEAEWMVHPVPAQTQTAAPVTPDMSGRMNAGLNSLLPQVEDPASMTRPNVDFSTLLPFMNVEGEGDRRYRRVDGGITTTTGDLPSPENAPSAFANAPFSAANSPTSPIAPQQPQATPVQDQFGFSGAGAVSAIGEQQGTPNAPPIPTPNAPLNTPSGQPQIPPRIGISGLPILEANRFQNTAPPPPPPFYGLNREQILALQHYPPEFRTQYMQQLQQQWTPQYTDTIGGRMWIVPATGQRGFTPQPHYGEQQGPNGQSVQTVTLWTPDGRPETFELAPTGRPPLGGIPTGFGTVGPMPSQSLSTEAPSQQGAVNQPLPAPTSPISPLVPTPPVGGNAPQAPLGGPTPVPGQPLVPRFTPLPGQPPTNTPGAPQSFFDIQRSPQEHAFEWMTRRQHVAEQLGVHAQGQAAGLQKDITEVGDQGQESQQLLQMVRMIEQLESQPEAYSVLRGQFGERWLEFTRTMNQLNRLRGGTSDMFDPRVVTIGEALNKLNTHMASVSARQFSARPSGFDLRQFQIANPGLSTSQGGSKIMLQTLAQLAERDIALANAARGLNAEQIRSGEWQRIRDRIINEWRPNISGTELTNQNGFIFIDGRLQPTRYTNGMIYEGHRLTIPGMRPGENVPINRATGEHNRQLWIPVQ